MLEKGRKHTSWQTTRTSAMAMLVLLHCHRISSNDYHRNHRLQRTIIVAAFSFVFVVVVLSLKSNSNRSATSKKTAGLKKTMPSSMQSPRRQSINVMVETLKDEMVRLVLASYYFQFAWKLYRCRELMIMMMIRH
jgi:hypothetical protein